MTSTNEMRRFLGLMSGTSGDGVDGTLVEVRGRGVAMRVRFLHRARVAYPPALRRTLLDLMAPAATRTETLARTHAAVGEVFAACAVRVLEESGMAAAAVSAIGSHGQTVCHLPEPGEDGPGVTLQIGDAARIAARTGIATVSDFRAADVACGGRGAPLVPWTDLVLFGAGETTRILQNLGGIANLTLLPAGGGPDEVEATDTGPGCMLLDELARRVTGDPEGIDRDGAISAAGTADPGVLEALLDHPFFRLPPPKTAGREEFGRGFAEAAWEAMERRALSPADRLATAARLTARSVADAYRALGGAGGAGGRVEVILCGGGARNPTLVRMLREERPEWTFRPIEDFGIPAEGKEGVSFAMLAAAHLDGVPANLPRVTGASEPCVLGSLTPGRSGTGGNCR